MWNPRSFSELKKAEESKTQNSGFFHDHLLARDSIHNGKSNVGPGHQPLTLSGLHHHLHEGSFTIFTAQNPKAQKVSAGENQSRNIELENELKKKGATYHKVKGKYGNEEDSFMVHHTKNFHPNDAERLGEKFGQESILHSTKGKHQLKYVTGENKGMHHPGTGYELKPKATDNFTMLPKEHSSKFSANLNFDEMNKAEHVSDFTHSYEIQTQDGSVHVMHFKFKK